MAINFDTSVLGLQKSNGDLLPRIIQYQETTTTNWITKTNAQHISEFDTNITPSNSASHILIIVNICIGADTNADLGLIYRRTISGGSIGDVPNSAGTSASSANCSMVTGMNIDNAHAAHYTGWHIDHPNTTSTVTYGLRAYPNGARTMYINRRGIDTTYTGRSRLVLLEIGDI